MKRKDFFQLVRPVTEKLYRVAYTIIPDDLQAEQLVIDSFNAFLIKEKKMILASREYESMSKKELLVKRRTIFKNILFHMTQIGVRRSGQLTDQTQQTDFKTYFGLEAKVRLVMTLRFDFQFTVEEIEEITGMIKYEVIEKLHNGRFLLLSEINRGVQP